MHSPRTGNYSEAYFLYSIYIHLPPKFQFSNPPEPPNLKNFANFCFSVKRRVKKFHSSTKKIFSFYNIYNYLIYNILSLNKFIFFVWNFVELLWNLWNYFFKVPQNCHSSTSSDYIYFVNYLIMCNVELWNFFS